jgi:hypothetical protein
MFIVYTFVCFTTGISAILDAWQYDVISNIRSVRHAELCWQNFKFVVIYSIWTAVQLAVLHNVLGLSRAGALLCSLNNYVISWAVLNMWETCNGKLHCCPRCAIISLSDMWYYWKHFWRLFESRLSLTQEFSLDLRHLNIAAVDISDCWRHVCFWDNISEREVQGRPELST